MMLDQMDEGGSPRIADFGVSREKYGTSTMTRIGTPTYCAPEILSGEHYSLPVDIYSFGILIYEMINGKAPWKSENLTAIQLMMRVAIKKERPPIPEDTEPDLEQLIKCCWDHEPNNRPTAEDMIIMFKTEDGLKTYFSMKTKKNYDNSSDNNSNDDSAYKNSAYNSSDIVNFRCD